MTNSQKPNDEHPLGQGEASPDVVPFLKWAGGKRWLVEQHSNLFPQKFNCYIEPFLGSGSVFFHLAPSRAILSDANADLIACYNQVREFPHRLAELLREHHEKHCNDYYYQTRAAEFETETEKAAKFLYLNRTCFNGIYRVNLKGEFNVPIGTKTNVVMKSDDFLGVSKRLKNALVVHGDFSETMRHATDGDFVYVDPPYTVQHNTNGFLKYNEKIFSWSDQVRLKEQVVAAANRGASVVVSNAAHESVIELYEGVGSIVKLSRASVLSGGTRGRGRYEEILVRVNV